ncbi:MAG: porin family protein [Bacteroidaceae bacterium]|nr:porin family protein [Bacteroidaceae bacterium]
MKKTKFIALALLAAFGMSAQAQLVTSQGELVTVKVQPKEIKPKKPRTFKWNIRAGYSIDKVDKEFHRCAGYDFDFGIVNDFEIPNLLWGVDLGFMSHNAKDGWHYDEKISASELYLNPYIGYKIPVVNSFAIVPYLGPYIGSQFAGDDGSSGEFKSGFSYGINVGADFFVAKGFYVDIHYKQGFNKAMEYYYYNESIKASKIVFGLGYQF